MNASTLSAAALALAALGASAAAAQETLRQYLSGRGKDDAVPWRFFCTAGPQSGYWTNLPVPSNWELHGFGSLSYRHEPTNAFHEQGRYQCDFTLPAAWSARRVFLVFDGVMTDTHAEVNGRPAGPDHQGGFYRFKYEVTESLKFGATNRLDVLVHKRSANASVNQAERSGDYWNFGGIYRPVYLEAVPQSFIERVAIDARADGAFRMEVVANGLAGLGEGLAVEARVFSLDGAPVGRPFTGQFTGHRAVLKTKIPAPRPWTAETPNLYRVDLRLLHRGQLLHRFTQRFGFRTLEVREGDGLYVNGRRVVLQGADRHSFWPESGRCLSEAVHRLDIRLMQEMNMNAVRMSHYPPDEQFLELCDELGLYVLDELAGWQAAYDTATGRKLVEELVTRDVNHPCILFWDNGNEGGWNPELDGEFARWDPQQRPVLHPWNTLHGVNTAHYLPYELARLACEGTPMMKDNPRAYTVLTNAPRAIYMPTEFAHGMFDGGSGAGLEDYWTLMRASKYLGGGFLWALVDEGVRRPDTGKLDTAGNLAPDGVLGPYRQKEGSFFTIKELWSPIVVSLPGQTALRAAPRSLEVENRYSFTDARQCAFRWQLRQFRRPGEAQAGFTVLAEGKAVAPSIPPGQKGRLALPLPAEARADALALRVEDPGGRELWTWVWPLPAADSFRARVEARGGAAPAVAETGEVLEIQAAEVTVRFSKQTGLLLGLRRGAQACSLANGPRPVVGSAALTSLEHKAEGAEHVVNAKFEGALQSVSWRVRGNGWVQCAYTYTARGPQPFHGVAFDYPESLVRKKKWLGDGPYRVWKNRLRGGALNVWENDYNNTITGWKDWLYPEFKGCFANVRWLQLQTAEGLLTAVPDGQFVQVLTPDLPPADLQAKTVGPLPQAGLAFLHGIPPVGDKFYSAKASGPQGQPNIAAGPCSGSFSLYFGPNP